MSLFALRAGGFLPAINLGDRIKNIDNFFGDALCFIVWHFYDCCSNIPFTCLGRDARQSLFDLSYSAKDIGRYVLTIEKA